MDRLEPRSAYTWSMSHRRGSDPTADLLRIEDEARPTVGDLIQPGQLIETSYGTGPYRVETVTPFDYFGATAWTLTLRQIVDGVVKGSADFSINEVVVQWEGDVPRFRMLFTANTDEVLLLGGAAYSVNRSGQFSLF